MAQGITFPRQVLLIEIDRRCLHRECNARMRIAVTKEEARHYRSFECSRCKRWHSDHLTAKEAPDWWPEVEAMSEPT